MNRRISPPGDYIYFKSQVPLHKIPIGSEQWRFYDFGPKVVPPLVCLPPITGTADVYYKQVMFLSTKGYRVIAADIPHAWNHQEWVHKFDQFLDAISVEHVHLYGTSLGGFLAQLYAQYRPRRVKSLILSNTFVETRKISAGLPWSLILEWAPPFLLKRYILRGIHDGPHEPFIADSVDFVVGQFEALSSADVTSRLSLNMDDASVAPLCLSDSFITIMDTMDFCAIPQELKDQVSERYPGATRAVLKSGGDFPFLSRPDEVNLFLQLHLRRVGVAPSPDLVNSISRTGGSGSSSDKNKNQGFPHDPPDGSGNTGMGDIDDLPESSEPESYSFDGQFSRSAKLCISATETIAFLTHESSIFFAHELYRGVTPSSWTPLLRI